jgi:hypothetical protein
VSVAVREAVRSGLEDVDVSGRANLDCEVGLVGIHSSVGESRYRSCPVVVGDAGVGVAVGD